LGALLGSRTICQVNLSTNLRRGTIRGLHYQRPPHADMKLVRCLRGESHHVIVDLREDSATFLQWHAVALSARTMNMLCVPEGFAHGFQSLQDNCELMYLVTAPYAQQHQGGLRYNDPALDIPWPLEVAEISDRDAHHPLLSATIQGEAA
jgi:dTDP-4-dehydrorhamnose 3,5-epimerase